MTLHDAERHTRDALVAQLRLLLDGETAALASAVSAAINQITQDGRRIEQLQRQLDEIPVSMRLAVEKRQAQQ